MEQIVKGWAEQKYRGSEDVEMQKENVRKHGPVVTWKMTEEERQAYINQHPIVYREELKPKLIIFDLMNPYVRDK
ncbi:hypothetical protein [Streptomyces sp. NRRL F-5630]|uniref:hypothetical protein n=2 Tax=Bacillati TaxID=1783272 RepID=UPI003EC006E3